MTGHKRDFEGAESRRELQRLEAVTASDARAVLAELDAETLLLRESWGAFCDLLAAVDEGEERFALPQPAPCELATTPTSMRAGRRKEQWSGWLLGGASLSLAAILLTALATPVLGPLGAASPVGRPAVQQVRLAPEPGNPHVVAREPAKWVEDLDEQIAQAGRYASWLARDTGASDASDDRALDLLLQHLDAMGVEAAGGSL